ncbi:MAG: YHS domain-containing (seleno)protein [Pseudomonadota bacterium]
MTLTRRSLIAFSVSLPIAAVVGRPVLASTPQIYAENGIAVDGSDVVAYFTKGEPVVGSDSFTHDWRGATWRFSSEENRAAFIADPEAYAPQYGGYCAWAVSEGYTASTIPEAWRIVDGKLYLNFSRRVQQRWERDIPARIEAADRNWPGVLA